MTDSARTEEIRARVAFYPPGSNCNYCYGSEHYAEDVPYLLTELTALREEVGRLRGAQAKQRENMVLQARVLLQAAAENWDKDEREYARINDEKARFLLMYLPDFKPEEFNA